MTQEYTIFKPNGTLGILRMQGETEATTWEQYIAETAIKHHITYQMAFQAFLLHDLAEVKEGFRYFLKEQTN